MQNKVGRKNIRNEVYSFLEHPKGILSYSFQAIIFLLIFISVGLVGLEYFNRLLFLHYEKQLIIINNLILVIFTIEFLLRLFTAPKKWEFIRKPLSIIDFLAIAPNYLEFILPIFVDTTELRVVRLVRLLRFTRSLRLLKLFHFESILKGALYYKGTILEAITPVLVTLVLLKVGIIFLETHGWWVKDTNLEQLFAIIGFALGIILSVKIEMTHDKFLQVENAAIRMYATLSILRKIINKSFKNKGNQAVANWTKNFLLLLHNPKSNNELMNGVNEKFYTYISKVEKKPADIHNYFLQISQDAAFCLSKKTHLTPKAYDTLLHQATLLYLILSAVFISGITGLISVFVATYVLYGMYYLTQDMDTIIAGEFNLINIRTTQLEELTLLR